jgi:hypothetical protein
MRTCVSPRTAKETIGHLCGVFEELNADNPIISKGLRFPKSPHLSLCDLHLWGKLKNVMYASNPHHLEALKQNIRDVVYNIQHCEFQKLSHDLFKRILACLIVEGRHFVHFL